MALNRKRIGLEKNIRNKFSTLRVVRHWNLLPREAADATSLEVSRASLGGALRNLVW